MLSIHFDLLYMRSFDIPAIYKSNLIGKIKASRKAQDPRKQDFNPTVLGFGPVQITLARHFGFCFGVENAIERAYKALDENPGKRIFLLSQMIHNPAVNDDLQAQGVHFIMDTEGNILTPWDEITADDVVLIPAFGTTLEIENLLQEKGIDTETYDTTCPFVEKVWKRSAKLGKEECTILIHGKPNHEETRATFSHASETAPALVIKNLKEAQDLSLYLKGEKSKDWFIQTFEGRYSKDFNPELHFNKIGVVNQTTMLASETQEIADFFKQVQIELFGENEIKSHFADTRDTLCYATNDNQTSTYELLKQEADLAIVVGGYNSSNTSHIVELCEQKFNTFFIKNEDEILDQNTIQHFNFHKKEMETTNEWLPTLKEPLNIILTSGASCPDTLLDKVVAKILSYFPSAKTEEEVIKNFDIL